MTPAQLADDMVSAVKQVADLHRMVASCSTRETRYSQLRVHVEMGEPGVMFPSRLVTSDQHLHLLQLCFDTRFHWLSFNPPFPAQVSFTFLYCIFYRRMFMSLM